MCIWGLTFTALFTNWIFFLNQAKVSFIENKAIYRGAAVYIASLNRCLWYEEYPFYNAEKALRWNNMFEYRGNVLHPDKNGKQLTGPEYDIATDTHHFQLKGSDRDIKVNWTTRPGFRVFV